MFNLYKNWICRKSVSNRYMYQGTPLYHKSMICYNHVIFIDLERSQQCVNCNSFIVSPVYIA